MPGLESPRCPTLRVHHPMSHQLWGSFHWWIWAFCDGGNKGGFTLMENWGIWHIMLVKEAVH